MNLDRYLHELRVNGEQLAQAAEFAGPDAPVPSCPGWTAGAAVGHLAKVHRWVCWIARGGAPEDFQYRRPAPEELLDFFRAGLTELAAALARATDGQPMHTLWPARSPRLFWARRQAHETAIHRVDLQLAAGYGVLDVEPDFAADGLDELVMGMLSSRLTGAGLDRSYTVLLEPLDVNAAWTLRLAPDGLLARREPASNADLSVFGMASDLYRWAWNRAGDDEVSLRGELPLADWWRSTVRVTAG
ncbi:MAG TPA: maleylpyruvate isomerase family mycothiol-dependent enzyme [Jatrophihabitans sp.]|nr:maleylpyruvate isomerase family mycothiol-dependent enzyme [Jatrophihabitans sp.]